MDNWQSYRELLNVFRFSGVSISNFLINLIHYQHEFALEYGTLIDELFQNAGSVLVAFAQQARSADVSIQWATTLSSELYKGEIRRLTDKSSGLHFNSSNARACQIRDFASGQLISRIATLAPSLWVLFQSLLRSDGSLITDGGNERKTMVFNLKTSIHIGSLIFANNQQCNILPAITGVFLHTCSASERIIDTMWRLNASVSVPTINRAINSLSVESKTHLQSMGQGLCVGYAFDNFDVAMKHSTGTVDQPISSLVHLTLGLILNLAHTLLNDLKHSRYLWERSKYNDRRKYPLPKYDPVQLFTLHPQTVTPNSLNYKEDFCRWQFAMDLCTHGPAYFKKFQNEIPAPKGIEIIPNFQTKSAPLKSMQHSNSTVEGNINTIVDSMEQTGVWDLDELKRKYPDIPDIEEIVVLVHGDLGTAERIQSARFRRSIEETSRRRLQFVVFIPGLFHVKIACADAIWRIFIWPAKLRKDTTCMLSFIRLFFPNLTTKIQTNKAGFHVLNDCIVRIGISDRLECWRTYVQNKWPGCDTLEKFAQQEPTLQDILSISKDLALQYASPSQTLEDCQYNDPTTRDYQYENTLARIDHVLLYEELSYSIRSGDVGRLETCLRRWIPIFKGTGKHKYANSLLEFMTDVHFVYPEDLRRAVRFNWLCNPLGKPMGFRGVDWLLELNNLYTKVIYGGSGSNYTVNRIINESVLIQLYRDCKKVIEDQYGLNPKTTRHGDPDLVPTFEALSQLAQKTSLLMRIPDGRASEFLIPNHFSIGMQKFEREGAKGGADTLSLLDIEEEEEITEEDLAVDPEDE